VENILEGFTGTVIVSVEDENAKFNLNSLVNQNKTTLNATSYESFRTLLRTLGLDESISDRVVDWIDAGSEPRLGDSEEGAKNAFMDSVDELLMIKGIDRLTYETLLPYVTVYGYSGNPYDPVININTASIPVIMSLGIPKDQAEVIVNYRKLTPFKDPSGVPNVPGVGTLGISLQGRIAVQPVNFRITSVAEENRIKRVIETVVTASGLNSKVKFWREM
jgi:type II secretory pathway component PulK